MISDKVKEDILSATDIVALISRDVQLKRRGIRMFGCCPFHQEKTPSFSVNPTLGKWYCFGCHAGGDAISYVMKHNSVSFVEACTMLAKEKGIVIETKEQTPEERRNDMEKEAMRLANRQAQEFFLSTLCQNTKAQEYAFGRWGQEFCNEIGIGYAPDSWNALTNYAKSHKCNTDIFLRLGLLKRNEDKGSIYDAYRNRITIPIVDISGNIIGFTARDISGEPSAPKYINSQESPIYNKSKSLFGIGTAKRETQTNDKLYLVEGAPDALRLHSIGIANAAACLGSHWTEEHFRLIKRLTANVCFIPDDDPPKKGEQLGVGVRAVMQSGQLAIQCGLTVSVKELNAEQDGTKHDCDSTITSQEQFHSLPEKDFVLWYTDKRNNGEGVNDHNALIKEISALVAIFNDEVKDELYAVELSKICGSRQIWRKSIATAKKSRTQATQQKETSIDPNQLLQFGFFESKGGYSAISDKNVEKEWSNFTLKPLFLIVDPICAKRLFLIKNRHSEEQLIEFKVEDLVSIPKFRTRIESIGDYVWSGSDNDLTRLKCFLYSNTDTAKEITQLGWQQDEFFAFGNGVYKEGMWFPTNDYGIVKLPDDKNFYLPSSSKVYATDRKLYQYERSFVHLNLGTVTVQEVFTQLQTVFEDNGMIGACFLLATLFRDIVTNTTKSFPLLNMFGPKGAGKSELGHSLMSFFVIKNNAPNIPNATLPALSDAVSKCANALVHLDEFKNDIDLNKREFLKGIWDGTGRSRMNMDKDKKMEMTSVDSGVMLSGQEMATADIALFSRFIFLRFTKTTYDDNEKQAFAKLQQMQSAGFSHLTLQLLNQRANVEREFPRAFETAVTDLTNSCEGETLEDRILKNWAIPLAIYRIVSKYIALPWQDKDMRQSFAEGIVSQQKSCRTNNEVGNFWECLSVLVQEGEAFKRCDYDIKPMSTLKTDQAEIEFDRTHRILLLRPSKIFALYLRQMRQLGETALPRASLKYYLENSPEYYGTKSAVRFTQIVKGQVLLEPITSREKQQIDRAMCFDYDRIVENHGIDIDVYTDDTYQQPTETKTCQQETTPF